MIDNLAETVSIEDADIYNEWIDEFDAFDDYLEEVTY